MKIVATSFTILALALGLCGSDQASAQSRTPARRKARARLPARRRRAARDRARSAWRGAAWPSGTTHAPPRSSRTSASRGRGAAARRRDRGRARRRAASTRGSWRRGAARSPRRARPRRRRRGCRRSAAEGEIDVGSYGAPRVSVTAPPAPRNATICACACGSLRTASCTPLSTVGASVPSGSGAAPMS
jgi:hypothetical protein